MCHSQPIEPDTPFERESIFDGLDDRLTSVYVAHGVPGLLVTSVTGPGQ
jgi:hypothetical protein